MVAVTSAMNAEQGKQIERLVASSETVEKTTTNAKTATDETRKEQGKASALLAKQEEALKSAAADLKEQRVLLAMSVESASP